MSASQKNKLRSRQALEASWSRAFRVIETKHSANTVATFGDTRNPPALTHAPFLSPRTRYPRSPQLQSQEEDLLPLLRRHRRLCPVFGSRCGRCRIRPPPAGRPSRSARIFPGVLENPAWSVSRYHIITRACRRRLLMMIVEYFEVEVLSSGRAAGRHFCRKQ